MGTIIDSSGLEWDMGSQHVCAGCPMAKDDECEHAWGLDPGDGSCPADHMDY